jgi:homoserine kinase
MDSVFKSTYEFFSIIVQNIESVIVATCGDLKSPSDLEDPLTIHRVVLKAGEFLNHTDSGLEITPQCNVPMGSGLDSSNVLSFPRVVGQSRN